MPEARAAEKEALISIQRILWHLFENRGQVMTEAYEAMGMADAGD